jgi:hypothetical protein
VTTSARLLEGCQRVARLLSKIRFNDPSTERSMSPPRISFPHLMETARSFPEGLGKPVAAFTDRWLRRIIPSRATLVMHVNASLRPPSTQLRQLNPRLRIISADTRFPRSVWPLFLAVFGQRQLIAENPNTTKELSDQLCFKSEGASGMTCSKGSGRILQRTAGHKRR